VRFPTGEPPRKTRTDVTLLGRKPVKPVVAGIKM
jgi:hypothetical protein